MPSEIIFTVSEFRQFCQEMHFSCFTYHTRNQKDGDTDMDMALSFPPPLPEQHSDIMCFVNKSKDRMVLRRVRKVCLGRISGTGIWKAEFWCGGALGTNGSNTMRSYIFTVT